jgi:hypothetical protein
MFQNKRLHTLKLGRARFSLKKNQKNSREKLQLSSSHKQLLTAVKYWVHVSFKRMEYSKFKVVEFVTDEYFVRSIKKPDPETNAFWNTWLSKNLQQLARVRRAREIIFLLDFEIHLPPDGRFQEVWEGIIKHGLEQQGETFNGASKYDFSSHNRKMYIVNAYRFRNWKLPTRQKVVERF